MSAENGQPLAGIKVCDFGWAVAGPVTTKYLALFGATVIKIETHTRFDGTRMAGPYRGRPGRNRSAYFSNHNMGKYSISLNLNLPRAQELARKLAAWADVVAENFSPGQMKGWGLAYPDIARVNPTVIMVSSSMQGQEGPHAAHPGMGHTLQGLIGLTHFTGWPDRWPLNVGEPYTDMISPWFQVCAILAALEHRQRTGKGMYLDLSQFETTLQFLAPAMLDYTVNGRVQTRLGNRDPYTFPHGVYRCTGQDRWIAIAAGSDEEWQALCRAMGGPAWALEEKFQTVLGRAAHADELDRRIEEWTQGQEAAEAMRRLQEAGVPAGVVATGKELHEDPQLQHRGHFLLVDHPEMGPHAHDGPAFRLSRTPPQPRPAPMLGQHNDHVYREILHLSEEEYRRLQEEQVIG